MKLLNFAHAVFHPLIHTGRNNGCVDYIVKEPVLKLWKINHQLLTWCPICTIIGLIRKWKAKIHEAHS